MVLDDLFERFLADAPACVMLRALMEATLDPDELDRHLEAASQGQYTRELLFSTLVDLMSLTVSGIRPSIHAAVRACRDRVKVSIQAVYGKLARTEEGVARELVAVTAGRFEAVRRALGAARPLLAGYRTLVVDGNHLAGTQHRLKVTRRTLAAALPGQALVVYQPELGLVTDVFPCQDAYAQERAILPQLLAAVRPGDLYLADRNFCTTGTLLDLAGRDACFVIRRHGSSLCCRPIGPARPAGHEGGRRLSEQALEVFDPKRGRRLRIRQITIHRSEQDPAQEDIHLLTNLPARVTARRIAGLYRQRWTIEDAFQDLTDHLGCEVHTLCYPKAALLAFCVALVSYNLWALTRAAIAQALGPKQEEEVSTYYLADEWRSTYRGMMIALPPPCWQRFQRMPAPELARQVLAMAARLDVPRYRRTPRGPKQPRPKRTSGKINHHVSTARLLAQQNGP